jgi:hypothetical protein
MTAIIPVYPSFPVFTAACCDCGTTLTNLTNRLYADLDGEPFKAYLCKACAAQRGAECIAAELLSN